MTNQEWLQQNNAKIEAIQEKLAHKVIAKGTIEITENGKHDVAGYSDANVNVPVPDLSATTATAEDVLRGKKFYNAQGEFVEGGYEDVFQTYADTKGFNSLFNGYKAETIPYLSKLDTSKATNMEYMFNYCTQSTSLDLSNFNTSNVTNMQSMFSGCEQLTSLDLSNFDTSKVTDMGSMFNSCKQVTSLDLSNFNTSNVTDMGYMFSGCRQLASLDLSNFNTSKVKDMTWMFKDTVSLTSLDLSNFNASNVTTLREMFSGCEKLASLNISNFNTSKVTNVEKMFALCGVLSTLDLSGFDTSNVTTMNQIFSSCKALENVLGEIDMIKTKTSTGVSSMFYNTQSLKNITLKNIQYSLTLGRGDGTGSYDYGTKLTNETLINTAQQLWDNTNNALGGSRTLSLSTTSKNNIANIYVKLIDVTDEMRAEDQYIDNKKPCVVCESTDDGAMTLSEYIISKNWAVA